MTKAELIEKLLPLPDDTEVADTHGAAINSVVYFEHTQLVFISSMPEEQTVEEYHGVMNWCCTFCHTSNGPDDKHCVNCGRKDQSLTF